MCVPERERERERKSVRVIQWETVRCVTDYFWRSLRVCVCACVCVVLVGVRACVWERERQQKGSRIKVLFVLLNYLATNLSLHSIAIHSFVSFFHIIIVCCSIFQNIPLILSLKICFPGVNAKIRNDLETIPYFYEINNLILINPNEYEIHCWYVTLKALNHYILTCPILK